MKTKIKDQVELKEAVLKSARRAALSQRAQLQPA